MNLSAGCCWVLLGAAGYCCVLLGAACLVLLGAACLVLLGAACKVLLDAAGCCWILQVPSASGVAVAASLVKMVPELCVAIGGLAKRCHDPTIEF